MGTLIISLAVAFFLVVAVFPFLIFPILSLVHCIRNPELSTQSKIGWGCLIFFTWTGGACIYGILVSKRPFYRNMGIVTASFMLLAVIAKKPLETYQAKQKTVTAAAKKQTLDTGGLADVDTLVTRAKIKIESTPAIASDLGTPLVVVPIPGEKDSHGAHGTIRNFQVSGPRGQGTCTAMYVPPTSSADKKDHLVLIWNFNGKTVNVP